MSKAASDRRHVRKVPGVRGFPRKAVIAAQVAVYKDSDDKRAAREKLMRDAIRIPFQDRRRHWEVDGAP